MRIMMANEFPKRCASFPNIPAVLLLFCALLTPYRAQADPVTYDLSATLASPVDGISTISGWFTVEPTGDSITAWQLTLSPVDGESTTGSTSASTISFAGLLQLAFGYFPGDPTPTPTAGGYISLIFDTPPNSLADLPPIDLSPLTVGSSTVFSGVIDTINGDSSEFTQATLAIGPPPVAPIPEPSSIALLLTGLPGIVFVIRKRLFA